MATNGNARMLQGLAMMDPPSLRPQLTVAVACRARPVPTAAGFKFQQQRFHLGFPRQIRINISLWLSLKNVMTCSLIL